MTRRDALRWVGSLVIGAMTAPASAQAPLTSVPPGFMERAFEMRRRAVERGDDPYGAVVVRGGQIVGEGASATVTDVDPTAHAEIQAIRDAARRLRTRDQLYGTSRACPMCEAAAYWARISRMYYGTSITDAGVPQLR